MKKILYLAFIAITILSCNDDKEEKAELKEFYVTNISDESLTVLQTELNDLTKKVYIFFDNDLSEITFPLTLQTESVISKGAKTSLNDQGELVFSNADEVLSFEIEAENGNNSEWLIYLVHKQLQNSHFDNWFENQGLNGHFYQEVGASLEMSIWATANMGTSTYSTYGSQPIVIENNIIAQIKTDSVQSLPLTAATIFTGYFNINGAIANPTNPKKATVFGTPFIYKPTAFTVDYKYTAGKWYKQASLINPSSIFGGFTQVSATGEDKCAIYAILENRDGESTVEVARAELFSSSTNDIMEKALVTFNYTSELQPTHITVVFSSSKDGDLWKGAVGSTLIIDNLKFIYD